jgi:hypothetical protein
MTLGRLADPMSLEPLRGARPKLLQSPLDWFLYRRVYDEAIKRVEPDVRQTT